MQGKMATEAQTGSAETAAPQAGGEHFEVLNPASGEPLERVAIDSPARVAENIARIRAEQPAWEALGPEGRRYWLEQLRDWLLDNEDRVVSILMRETGKVRGDAMAEMIYLADTINFYGARAKRFLSDDRIRPHSPLLATRRLSVQYRPHPVVGIISPWNFPLALSIGDAVPALMAGAAVIVKPSEFTPLAVREIIEAWRREIGAPDVFAHVQGMGPAGEALIDGVDFVQFTGSDRTGRKVMARAAETLTPVSLELGGKDPMIVLRGANLDRAANAAAWGGMMNSGQVCMSVERIYVEQDVYQPFVDKLVSKVESLRQGSDLEGGPAEVGSMTSPNQIEIVERQVNEALAAGARALTGGRRRPGAGDFFEPTVLVDVDHSMSVMRDETFGPVVGVMPVRDAEEALRLANDSRYGLSASVFGPPSEAEAIARRIECGAVDVNDVLVHYLTTDVPMGGWKQSGIGYRHAEQGLRKFCRAETVLVNRLPLANELTWYPYGRTRRAIINAAARLVNARGLRRRFGR
jgi:acyl-CoA reductase-like NAD-dependent aldehyde dehydrogenase